jgi:hypothetical protein
VIYACIFLLMVQAVIGAIWCAVTGREAVPYEDDGRA